MIKKAIKKIPYVYNKYLQYKIRKNWFSRANNESDKHLELYWNDHGKVRKKLVDILDTLFIENKTNDSSILEFGSHVGTNLKLLSEKHDVEMYAIEPNVEAYEFLSKKLPFVHSYNFDDDKFIKANIPSGKVYISLINSVFYCMTPSRVKSVLNKLSKISTIIVIGDSMKCIDASVSNFNQNPICYSHPYKKWLEEFGFTKFENIELTEGQMQLDGYLIAKKY